MPNVLDPLRLLDLFRPALLTAPVAFRAREVERLKPKPFSGLLELESTDLPRLGMTRITNCPKNDIAS